jgi:hypothetical protein
MVKIATHNSATGEKAFFPTRLFNLFSMCQNKTLIEQYNVGVRFFDIRIKKNNRGWICAHGLWQSKKSAYTLLEELNNCVQNDEKCYITLMYEGNCSEELLNEFLNIIKEKCPKLTIVYIGYKKPTWTIVKYFENIHFISKFKGLDFSSWHTFIPIPYLWKKIYNDDIEFNEDYFIMVDFI